MKQINLQAVTTDRISIPGFADKRVKAYMLRLDKINPVISGNKWFKLKYYLEDAGKQNKKKIITFGGAWSNHIIATAAACRLHTFGCAGIIRGEKPEKFSDTLQYAANLGMELFFISRKEFAAEHIPDELTGNENYIIRQGGYGERGAKGAAEIPGFADPSHHYTHICCAAGTGTMMAGLINAAGREQQVIGISVLKNNFQIENDVQQLVKGETTAPHVLHDYHFGGYAKYTTELLDFMNDWYRQTAIPTDFVYTGKLCFAVNDLVSKEFFPEGSRLLIIHSGGLTGNVSLKKGTLIF